MTGQTHSTSGSFSPRSLEHVLADLSEEMSRLKRTNPEVYLSASKLFKENPEAKTQVGAAEVLLTNVRALAYPQSVPVGLEGLFEEEAGEAQRPVVSPVDAVAPDEDEVSSQDEEVAPEVEEAQGPTPAEPISRAVEWPEGTLGAGLISQLAQTLQPGDTVTFVLTRLQNKLLVSVQPTPIKGEPSSTALPLQAKETPARLDEQLGAAFNDYSLGRQIAREAVADGYAEKVKAAAKKPSPKPAAKPAATSDAAGRLFVEVSPKDAVGVLTDSQAKTHPFTAGVQLTLPADSYTLNLDAEGYRSSEEKLVVRAGKDTKTGVVLSRVPEPGLFNN